MSTQYRYPCENCGASLEFSPGQQTLVCPYCGHVQQIEDAPAPPQSGVPKVGNPAGPALQWDAKHKYAGLTELPLADLVNSPAQVAFGQAKLRDLPAACRSCDVRFACHGDCPKHRFGGEVSHLCAAYQRFFRHVAPTMRFMASELRSRRSPAGVMRALAAQEGR